MENRKSDYVDLIEGNIHSWITRHSIKQINKPFFTDNHQKCGWIWSLINRPIIFLHSINYIISDIYSCHNIPEQNDVMSSNKLFSWLINY